MKNRYYSLALAAGLAVGGVTLVGCESESNSGRTQHMSNVQERQEGNPQQLSNERNERQVPGTGDISRQNVQRFDEGAYDSTTGNRGGD